MYYLCEAPLLVKPQCVQNSNNRIIDKTKDLKPVKLDVCTLDATICGCTQQTFDEKPLSSHRKKIAD